MHYLQKQILDNLRSVNSMRYTDLMPDGVESGHFRYHLAELVSDGLVESAQRGIYSLSPAGNSFVDKLSSGRIHPHAMPKVITYTLLTDGDKVVLQRKTKHPYKDLLNMIGGKVHEAESSQQAAVREVAEKTGQQIDTVELRGIFEIFVDSDDRGGSHVVAFVFGTAVKSESFNGEGIEVISISELPKRTDLAPDFVSVFGAISDPGRLAHGTFHLKFDKS